MKQTDEYALYLQDRAAWAEYVAPRRAEMLRHAVGDEKRRLWESFGEESRAAIKRLADQS